MTQPGVMARIERCIALSGSDNEHEAALALDRARILMRRHQLTAGDLAPDVALALIAAIANVMFASALPDPGRAATHDFARRLSRRVRAVGPHRSKRKAR